MRRIILSAALSIGLTLPAWAVDFLVSYGSEEQLLAVAAMVPGLTVENGGKVELGHSRGQWSDGRLVFEWVVTDPFRWPVPTGETYTDPFGNQQPVMVDKPGWFRVFRFNGDPALLMPYILAGGGTLTPGADGAMTITAGPVTMTAPLPADCPVTF